MIEEIAGDQHQIDALLRHQRGDLVEDGAVLVGAAAALDQPADVPVRGMEDSQDRFFLLGTTPSNGSSASPPVTATARAASPGRVAHAGNGNSRTTGIGSSGWDTTMVFGRAKEDNTGLVGAVCLYRQLALGRH